MFYVEFVIYPSKKASKKASKKISKKIFLQKY